jgi:hypothetical protein
MDHHDHGDPLLRDRADRHVDRQRLAAADDGQSRSDARRDRLGRHGVRGRQRDHRADGELARHVLRQAKLLRGVDRALHGGLVLLRPCVEHLGARALPLFAGGRRRRAAFDLAVDPRRDVSAGGARLRDLALWHGHRRRPYDRADARRMDHRQLHVAVDLLRELADRRAGRVPHVDLRARSLRDAGDRPHRLAGHRAARRRRRLAADRSRAPCAARTSIRGRASPT